MMLTDLNSQIATSLKSGDHLRVETLRFLLSAVRYAVIAKYANEWETKTTEADITDVIKKQVKTHKESVDAYTKAGRQDLVEKEEKELVILQAFLPKEISDEELKNLIAPVLTSGEKDFGKLMRLAMAGVAGKADGGRVSQMLKSLLAA